MREQDRGNIEQLWKILCIVDAVIVIIYLILTSGTVTLKNRDTIETIEKGRIVYGTKGYNPSGSILEPEGSVNYLELDKKSQYPFSPICVIVATFKTPKGTPFTVNFTGQLVSDDKILTCGHGFLMSKSNMIETLKAVDLQRSASVIVKTDADTLFEAEIAEKEKLIASKQEGRQARIDEQLTEFDKKVLEQLEIRPRIKGRDYREKWIEDTILEDGTVISMVVTLKVEDKTKQEIIAKNDRIIADVDAQIQNEIETEIEYCMPWEIEGFESIQVDFMCDAENDTLSSTDTYMIGKNDVQLHPEFKNISSHKDFAVIKTNDKLGLKYGWLGMLEGLENKKLYSLAGYPTEIRYGKESSVFKNINLMSNISNFGPNMGTKNSELYWYSLTGNKGISGAGLKVRSNSGDDFRVVSIHRGKEAESSKRDIGCIITGDIISWVNGIK